MNQQITDESAVD